MRDLLFPLLFPLVFVASNAVKLQTAVAQEVKPESARQVIEKYIEALGGKLQLQSQESFKLTGRVFDPEHKESVGTIEIDYAQGKTRSHTVNEPGFSRHGRESTTGFDGEFYWVQSRSLNYKSKSLLLRDLKREAMGDPALPLEWLSDSRLKLIRFNGLRKYEEKSYYELEFAYDDRKRIKRQFDARSGLLTRVQMDPDIVKSTRWQTDENRNVVFLKEHSLVFEGNPGEKIVIDEISFQNDFAEGFFQAPDGLKEKK